MWFTCCTLAVLCLYLLFLFQKLLFLGAILFGVVLVLVIIVVIVLLNLLWTWHAVSSCGTWPVVLDCLFRVLLGALDVVHRLLHVVLDAAYYSSLKISATLPSFFSLFIYFYLIARIRTMYFSFSNSSWRWAHRYTNNRCKTLSLFRYTLQYSYILTFSFLIALLFCCAINLSCLPFCDACISVLPCSTQSAFSLIILHVLLLISRIIVTFLLL